MNHEYKYYYRRFRQILLAVLFCLFMTGCVQQPLNTADTTNTVSGTEQFSVHYIDVGQGDATLIQCGTHAMLIDAGNNNKGTAVRAYLLKQGVERLDIAIGTHGDADHIGGLDVILYNFDCDTILLPDRKRDTKTYTDVIDTIENRNQKITYPQPGQTYALGEATVEIIAPCSYDYGDNENNYSIGVLVTYGNTKFLFVGDAEEEAEQDIINNGIDIDCDVYKVSHHGSSTATSSAFLDAALPEYAVISCGVDNDYGHPHKEVLNELNSRGIKIFRTDEQGTIIATSDGDNVTFKTENESSADNRQTTETDNSQAAIDHSQVTTTERVDENTEEIATGQIIGNKNSKKYHTTDCGALPAEKNRVYFTSEEAAEQEDYEICGNCKKSE